MRRTCGPEGILAPLQGAGTQTIASIGDAGAEQAASAATAGNIAAVAVFSRLSWAVAAASVAVPAAPVVDRSVEEVASSAVNLYGRG